MAVISIQGALLQKKSVLKKNQLSKRSRQVLGVPAILHNI